MWFRLFSPALRSLDHSGKPGSGIVLTARYVGLEARETPAVKGEDFSLDFPFYRTSA
jgi:hypothetical protein